MSELEVAKIKSRIDEDEILGNTQPIRRKGTRKRTFEKYGTEVMEETLCENIVDDSLIEPREIIEQVKKLMPEERYIRSGSLRKRDYIRLTDFRDK